MEQNNSNAKKGRGLWNSGLNGDSCEGKKEPRHGHSIEGQVGGQGGSAKIHSQDCAKRGGGVSGLESGQGRAMNRAGQAGFAQKAAAFCVESKGGRNPAEPEGVAVDEADRPGLNQGFIWRGPGGEVLSCLEKLKILEENLAELRQMYADAQEDAILLGASRESFLENFAKSIEAVGGSGCGSKKP